jgi:hypothetical protein
MRPLQLQDRGSRHRGAGKYYCCAHCARHSGAQGVSDRAA